MFYGADVNMELRCPSMDDIAYIEMIILKNWSAFNKAVSSLPAEKLEEIENEWMEINESEELIEIIKRPHSDMDDFKN